MCRLYGHLSVQPSDPSDYLWQASCSLLAQSTAKNDFKQEDGWGVASLKGKNFQITKSEKPVFKQENLWKKTARANVSTIAIAHLRAASNPLKLAMKNLIAKKHNQPFGEKNYAFAHNGTLNIAKAARERIMGPYEKHLEGNNDSEIYFWLLKKWIDKCGDVEEALHHTVNEIWQLWRSLSKKERGEFTAPYTGLNAVVSDGKKLYALCHSLRPQTMKSLCLKDQPYNRLAYKINKLADRFVIGSEKMSHEAEWKVVPMHSLTIAQNVGGEIKFKVKDFKWPSTASAVRGLSAVGN